MDRSPTASYSSAYSSSNAYSSSLSLSSVVSGRSHVTSFKDNQSSWLISPSSSRQGWSKLTILLTVIPALPLVFLTINCCNRLSENAHKLHQLDEMSMHVYETSVIHVTVQRLQMLRSSALKNYTSASVMYSSILKENPRVQGVIPRAHRQLSDFNVTEALTYVISALIDETRNFVLSSGWDLILEYNTRIEAVYSLLYAIELNTEISVYCYSMEQNRSLNKAEEFMLVSTVAQFYEHLQQAVYFSSFQRTAGLDFSGNVWITNLLVNLNHSRIERLLHEMPARGLSELCANSDQIHTCLSNDTLVVISSLSELAIGSHRSRATIAVFLYILFLLIQAPIFVITVQNANSTSNSVRSVMSVFAVRVTQLKKEKRKSDNLLSEMLPKTVAKQLKLGQAVLAQHYDSATVYFSDIDDFADISSKSTPMDIVTFLNNVYNFMDSRIELHDVYKVETIGSVYMVASGVPIPNRGRHVAEISSLALDILSATEDFVITHLPGRILQLRIGIHTGPVVTGVVGNKMPRYCLFGDTVNTAARMQSTGLASKIHISEATRGHLEEVDGFIVEERGSISVKGKGTMTTHWLLRRVKRKRQKGRVQMTVQQNGWLDDV